MSQRIRHFDHEEQARAIARAQDAVWRGVVARFEQLKAIRGLRQADLAAALGVSRPQIHEWLSDPRNMTLKAAGRLLLAMDAHAHVEVQAVHDAAASAAPSPGASGKDRRNADAFGPPRPSGSRDWGAKQVQITKPSGRGSPLPTPGVKGLLAAFGPPREASRHR